MRRHIHAAVFVLFATFLPCETADAQITVAAPGVESILSTEVGLISKSLGLQAKELAKAVQMVSNVVKLLRVANNSLAVARAVKRAYETIRNYSWKDLKSDAMRGLNAAMPQLQEMQKEWSELKESGRAIGSGNFWQHRNFHDIAASKELAAAVHYSSRAAIYPSLAPEAWENIDANKQITVADRLVELHFAHAGMQPARQRQNTAMAMNALRLKHLIADAEDTEQVDLKAVTATAATTHQTAVNTQFLRDAEAARIAQQESNAQRGREAEEIFRHSIGEENAPLLGIGVVK